MEMDHEQDLWIEGTLRPKTKLHNLSAIIPDSFFFLQYNARHNSYKAFKQKLDTEVQDYWNVAKKQEKNPRYDCFTFSLCTKYA